MNSEFEGIEVRVRHQIEALFRNLCAETDRQTPKLSNPPS